MARHERTPCPWGQAPEVMVLPQDDFTAPQCLSPWNSLLGAGQTHLRPLRSPACPPHSRAQTHMSARAAAPASIQPSLSWGLGSPGPP